jgi:hypothetical protein
VRRIALGASLVVALIAGRPGLGFADEAQGRREPAATTRNAGANVPPGTAAGAADLLANERIEISAAPPEGRTSPGPGETDPNAPPPMRPRHKGFVLEAGIGMLGFAGQFRHVAPPAYWLHTQLGFEVLPWLMVFGEGELAFTDTSESEDASHTVAFPIWGFGAGVRATIHASDRVAFFVQGEVGAFTATVPHDALAVVGFRQAESLNLDFGGRLGVEWYQVDRHFALTAGGGPRLAQGFSRLSASHDADTPLMWDVGAGLRYTF